MHVFAHKTTISRMCMACRATGKDAGKKLRQVTVGNLTLSLVPDELSGDLGEDMDAVLARLESDDIDPSTEHNYYQVRHPPPTAYSHSHISLHRPTEAIAVTFHSLHCGSGAGRRHRCVRK